MILHPNLRALDSGTVEDKYVLVPNSFWAFSEKHSRLQRVLLYDLPWGKLSTVNQTYACTTNKAVYC
jgi:hypothetical protein